jgi:hypothetical protein
MWLSRCACRPNSGLPGLAGSSLLLCWLHHAAVMVVHAAGTGKEAASAL